MKKQNKIIIFAVIILAIFIASRASNGSKTDLKRNEFYVRNVVDGDTIELSNGRMVRYIGVDTPEVRRRSGNTWIYDPEPYALEAKEFNKKLVDRKVVKLEFDIEKEDKYGRWLAYVYSDEEMVNVELIREGYAVMYIIPPNVKYRSLLLEAQEEAKGQRLRIWRSQETIPRKWR